MSALPTFTSLGSGPVLLMLHDLCGGWRAFAPQVESFACAGYRAVAWDMPGWGHSAPIEPYGFKGLAQRCIALIEALAGSQAPEGVILLGQGLGGMVAQEVVARRPDLVRRLVLAATAADGRGLADALTSQAGRLDAGGESVALAQTLVPQWIGPGALPEGVQLAQYCLAEGRIATYRRALQAMAGFDRRAALAQIHVPTLLIAGEWDRLTPPAEMRAMAAAIAGSRYLELTGVGHLPSLEAPQAFDALVLDFLATPQPPLH